MDWEGRSARDLVLLHSPVIVRSSSVRDIAENKQMGYLDLVIELGKDEERWRHRQGGETIHKQ